MRARASGSRAMGVVLGARVRAGGMVGWLAVGVDILAVVMVVKREGERKKGGNGGGRVGNSEFIELVVFEGLKLHGQW